MITKNTQKTLASREIVEMDGYDGGYVEVGAVDMPVVGKKYFVWTREYVGPNRSQRAKKQIRWTDDPETNANLIKNGMGGNSNNFIKKYHGWRGTTDDNAVYACGVRVCLVADRKELKKTVQYKIVFGADEAADHE